MLPACVCVCGIEPECILTYSGRVGSAHVILGDSFAHLKEPIFILDMTPGEVSRQCVSVSVCVS